MLALCASTIDHGAVSSCSVTAVSDRGVDFSSSCINEYCSHYGVRYSNIPIVHTLQTQAGDPAQRIQSAGTVSVVEVNSFYREDTAKEKVSKNRTQVPARNFREHCPW